VLIFNLIWTNVIVRLFICVRDYKEAGYRLYKVGGIVVH